MKYIILLFCLFGATAQAHEGPEASVDRLTEEIEKALSSYEQIRALLAQDKTEGITKITRGMKRSVSRAYGSSAGDLRAHLKEIDKAVRRLKSASKKDIATIRNAFGDLSKVFISLLAVDASLARHFQVFECSMTRGYPKWFQEGTNMKNPYMGAQMSSCGAASSWK